MNRIYRTATLVLVSLCCMSSSSACNPGHEEWNPDTPPHEQPGGDEGKDELYPKEDGVIRLVTYNVGVFSKYMDDSTAMIADMMNELGADALAVNELDWYNDRHNTDQLKNLASALGEWDYMYGKAIEYRNGYYGEGAAVKSSLGVKDKYEVPLPQGVGAEARVLVVIETEKFVFASTHLDPVSDEARTEQAGLISSALKEKYGESGKPVFLCGDLNSTPDSGPISVLRQDWTILSPLSATFPSTVPVSCIDYIMILNNGAEYEAGHSAVCRRFNSGDVEKASDHLPVYVDVRL